MKFVFERKFFAERSKNLERSEKFSTLNSQFSILNFQLLIMDIKNYVKTYFEQIDWNQEPKNLYEPIDYALQSGGKRIRPTLVLMAAQMFGGDIEK